MKKYLQSVAAGSALALMAVCCLASPADAIPASTKVAKTSPAAIAQAKAFFDRYGVDDATSDRLLSDYEEGDTWLSMSGSATPISSRTQDDGDARSTVDTYADGSITVQRLEKPDDAAPGTRSISGCSHSGTAYSNCKAEMWWGLVAMSFRVSYNLQSGNNRVTSVYGGTWSIGGSCSTKQQYFGRPNTKVARLDVLAQMCVIPHSEVFWLQFSVGGNKTSLTMG